MPVVEKIRWIRWHFVRHLDSVGRHNLAGGQCQYSSCFQIGSFSQWTENGLNVVDVFTDTGSPILDGHLDRLWILVHIPVLWLLWLRLRCR